MSPVTASAVGERLEVEAFVDASLFLGMHAADEDVRRACKGFFVSALASPLAMSYEEVGRCDDVVWSHPRAVQDAYYPFMDTLHSELSIRRAPLRKVDVDTAEADPRLAGLADADRFAAGMAVRAGARIVTVNPRLLAVAGLPAEEPATVGEEPRFPDHLEELYQRSLALRLSVAEVTG